MMIRAANIPRSMASKREADRRLPDAGHGSVGVARPIRVECYGDRLVVVSERGPDGNKVIALGPRMAPAIDPLISAVWEQMETLGDGRTRHVLAARAPGLRGPGRRSTFCRIIDPAGGQRADGGKEIADLMPRARTPSSEPVNSDSFLDIVASVVSIMIIMVVMEGTRIKNAPVKVSLAATPPRKNWRRSWPASNRCGATCCGRRARLGP